ncbi:hypothetical protein EO94_15715 [Methanosarcina sp. 2.H.T.1A.3]|nr:hypothetical protein EO94_15715 [Methanosarcina sp. 2.H.T.1A.3]
MKYQRVNISNKVLLCLILFFLILMSAYVTHAETLGRQFAYITNNNDNTVSVIDTSTNTVTATVPVGDYPMGVAVNPTGTKVYVANYNDNSISVIDTSTNAVTATVSAGNNPRGVAVNPTGTNVYVTNYFSNSVSVIDTSTNTVTATVSVGSRPMGVAVNPTGTKVYVANYNDNTVSVIDTSTNTVTDSVSVGSEPVGVAVTPDGTKAYVANQNSNTISVIDTSTNTVTDNVTVGLTPFGVAVTPDGKKVYVANYFSNSVYVIDTSTNTVTATVSVGSRPIAFGQFIGSVPVQEPVLPVANFSSNVTSGSAPLSVQFTDSSLNATGWDWDFGDGFNSTEQNPSHVYVSSGSYTVNLTVTNTARTNTSSRAGYILVSPPVPTAAFNGTPTSGTVPMNITFTDLSTGNPTGWAWFFGDEPYTQTWTQMNASSGWPARICYSSVVLPDGSIVLMGGWDGTNKLNDVWRSTNKGATWTKVSNAGWSARAHHSSVVLPDGSIVLMGGSDSTSSRNDTWQSTDKGITWTLVNASSGWTGRYYHSSVALPDGSIVLMGGSDDATWRNDTWRSEDKGATWKRMNESAGWTGRIFHSSASLPDGSIILTGGLDGTARLNDTWLSEDKGATWTLINGSSGWMGRTSHSSVAMPDGSVLLMGGLGIDNTPLHDIWRSTDKGRTWTKVADAGWSGRYYHNVVALSDGSIVLMGGLDDTTLLNDTWRLQPTGSNDPNPTHTYTAPGTYKVTLQAFNAGGYNSTCKTGYVTVTQSSPTAAFNGTPISGTEPLTVTFADRSTGEPTTWFWDFGDGTNSTEQHPSHTFYKAGSYTVNLTVSNGNGTNSTFATITVLEYNPAYTIDKTVTDLCGSGPSANVNSAGDVISYQIRVNNTGNVDLTNVSVNDPLLGDLTGPLECLNSDGILEVRESWIYCGTYTVNQEDLNNNGGGDGFINNAATVDCAELNPKSDSAAVSIEQKPACKINKIVIDVAGNGPEGRICSAGDVVSFQVNVTNNGNIDLKNISVRDSMLNLRGPYGDTGLVGLYQSSLTRYTNGGDGILSVGEAWYYLGNYTVTQEDLNNNGGGDGFLNSTVTFDSSETEPINETTIHYVDESGNESENESSGIRIEQNPDYSIYKSVIEVENGKDGVADNAGDVIRYRILVKNEGNVDLTGVSVNDQMITLEGPLESKAADRVLEVGENWTCTGNYTVTQEDINSNGGGDGYIDNTATVSCNELSNKNSSVKVLLPAAEISGGRSGHGSGTGSARIVSDTSENVDVNRTSTEENETQIQFEEETEYVEKETGNETAKPQTNEEIKSKIAPVMKMIYRIAFLLIACLLIVFMYKRRQEEQK